MFFNRSGKFFKNSALLVGTAALPTISFVATKPVQVAAVSPEQKKAIVSILNYIPVVQKNLLEQARKLDDKSSKKSLKEDFFDDIKYRQSKINSTENVSFSRFMNNQLLAFGLKKGMEFFLSNNYAVSLWHIIEALQQEIKPIKDDIFLFDQFLVLHRLLTYVQENIFDAAHAKPGSISYISGTDFKFSISFDDCTHDANYSHYEKIKEAMVYINEQLKPIRDYMGMSETKNNESEIQNNADQLRDYMGMSEIKNADQFSVVKSVINDFKIQNTCQFSFAKNVQQ